MAQPTRCQNGRDCRWASPACDSSPCEMLRTMPTSPEVIDAIGGLLPPLLTTLERVSWVERHLFPPPAQPLPPEPAPRTPALAGPVRALRNPPRARDPPLLPGRLVC